MRAEDRARREVLREAGCLHCGCRVGHGKRKWCAEVECQRARKRAGRTPEQRRADRKRYGYTEATAERYHRRRALKKGATVEKFSHAEVFDRDHWVCGICTESVDPALQFPDPRSVSLDHIVPLALGGEHSRANAQCAHLICNTLKGATAA